MKYASEMKRGSVPTTETTSLSDPRSTVRSSSASSASTESLSFFAAFSFARFSRSCSFFSQSASYFWRSASPSEAPLALTGLRTR